MKGLLFAFTSITVFFIGCQTLTPNKDMPYIQDWIADYSQLNQLSPSLKSCEGFKKLLQKDFPLKEMAALRGSLHCGEILKVENSFPWLKEEWTPVQIAVARSKNDLLSLGPLLVQRSKESKLKEEKEKLILEAQKISNQISPTFQEEVEKRLYEVSPRFNKNFKKENILEVANDFRRAREFHEARRLYVKVLNDSFYKFPEKIKAFEGLARIEKLGRDKEEYVRALKMNSQYLEKVSRRNDKWRTLVRKELKNNEIELARALWTIGKRSEAEKILKKRVSERRKTFSYAIHYWLLGRIEEEKKNTDEALKWLRLSINEVQDNLNLESQARWFLAWNLFKDEKYQEAIEQLDWFENDKVEDFTKARALYWKGVSFDKLKDTKKSQDLFKQLVRFDPLGYYGLLAKRELGEGLQKPSASVQSQDSYFFRMKLRNLYFPEWVDWLHAMHEREPLKKYLDHIAKTYSQEKTQDERIWLALFKSYAKSGEYLGLFQKLYTISPETRDQLLQDHPELLFPTPFRVEINQAAQKFKVDPELIYSIIRQESAFDPEARSPADAFGLMQLLPRVAEKLGEGIGISIGHYTDLYQPEKNIPIGALLISNQKKRHKGNFIATVASYNASDRAIRGWQESRHRPSPIEFIEEIPYEETKGYVRLIIRNYAFYRLLLSSQNETLFPDETLGLKDWLTGHQSLDSFDVSN